MKIKNKKRTPFLPINSMSDIAFLLLIFIMLLSLINYKREIKIDYPEAEYQEITQKDKNFEIYVDKSGVIYYDGKIVDIVSLETLIVDAVIKNPDIRMHIKADRNTNYENVDKVINILKLLQHRVVSLVVKENK